MYKHLTYADRLAIEKLLKMKKSISSSVAETKTIIDIFADGSPKAQTLTKLVKSKLRS